MRLIKIFFFSILYLSLNNISQAQNYTTLAEVLSSGGGESTGSGYSNFGVVGETFVNNSAFGGDYTTSIGFLYVSDIIVDITEFFDKQNIRIFPNPSSEIINIDKGNSSAEIIEIYDIFGNIIFNNFFKNTLNISYYPSGMYILKLIDSCGKVIFSKKIIKN